MSWFYYQYLLVTALYMLEPWERTVFSILPGPRVRGPGRERGGPGGMLPGPGPGGGGSGGRRGGGEGGEVVRSTERWCGARAARAARARTDLFTAGARGGGPGPRTALPVGAGVGERELLRSEVEASLSLEEIP